jgi:IS5 family transposase
VAQKKKGSAIDRRTTRHAGYAVSLKIRKRVEEVFGWGKTVGPLRKARFVGLAKVKAQTLFTVAAYNLTRMATIFGWRLSTA